MSLFESIILGLVQGLTEFIPVSSSGHLILVREFFGISSDNGLAIDAILQLATGLAILAYFIKEVPEIIKNKTLLKALVIGTIPAVFFGLLLEDLMESTFRNAYLVSLTLILGALLMIFAEKFAKQNTQVSVKSGIMIGLFQCLALVPGMSRSGSTISGGLFAGLKREDAARFSFLLAFPIIMGSGLKKVWDLTQLGLIGDIGMSLFVGCLTAFVSGFVAIKFLMNYLKTNKLIPFALYRIVLAVIIVFAL